MRSRGPEYFDVQRPAIALLCEQFGYAYADGGGEAFLTERAGAQDVLLRGRLAAALRRINPDLPEAAVQTAIEALERVEGATLVEANEAAHTLLSRWLTLKVPGPQGEVGRSVRYIDYDNLDNNDFLLVEEFRVRRRGAPRRTPDDAAESTNQKDTRRADLTLFVNGIPLAVIECKAPGKEHAMKQAVDQLLQYQGEDEVPQLFAYCHFTAVVARERALFGTVGTPHKYYAPWNDAYPLSRDDLFHRLGREPTAQDVLLAGLFRPENLLDLLHSYVVFDVVGGRKVKKVARYPQYQAVNETLARLRGATQGGEDWSKRPLAERGGTVWHTQGSGKSLTMLWLAVKIRRDPALKNPTILLVTDRVDLDKQLHTTFIACGFENPLRARKVTTLRELLRGAGGQTLSTTVFKFRKPEDEEKAKARMPVLSNAHNIIALVDEAHRSESGLFAAQMRAALPHVCRIAFTATPLTRAEKKRKTTITEFGPYIHRYTMEQSERDGATVPIYYEARHSDLAVWGKIEPLFNAEFSDLTPEQRRTLKKRELTAEKVALAEDRIEKIALDIHDHYTKYIEPNGFKAQLAACSQRAALRYYNALNLFPALADRVAVIISAPAKREDADLVALHDQFKNNEDTIITQFKESPVEKMAILIVVDRLLTGFDAPIEQVLYLDKGLRDHALLQAIARVNRRGEGNAIDTETGGSQVIEKEYGLIIDYWGVTRYLHAALLAFDTADIGTPMSPRADDEVFEDLKQAHRDVLGFFPAGLPRTSTEDWVAALAAEDVLAHFRQNLSTFLGLLDRLLPDTRALPYLTDASWLEKVKHNARVQYDTEDLALVGCTAKVRRLIDQHVKTEAIVQMLTPVHIGSDNFYQEVEKLTSPRAKAERIWHATRKAITQRRDEDPAFFDSVEKRLQEIISTWKQGRLEDIEAFRRLQTVQTDVSGHQASSESAIAGILALHQQDAPFGVREPGPDYRAADSAPLATVILDALRPYTDIVDWVNKSEVQRQMRREIKARLRAAGVPEGQVEQIVLDIMDYAIARLGK